jgi:hypothetical protein
MSLKKLNKSQLIERVHELNAQVAASKNAQSTLDKSACYIGNVEELVLDVSNKFTSGGDVIKVDFITVREFIQTIWDKVKESSLECRNTEIKVKTGFWVKSLLAILGLKL